jgi:uncharacterized membrane protein YbhN (UPF0104 family)
MVVSATVLSVLLLVVPWRPLVTAFRMVPPSVVVSAVGLFLLGHVVAAMKWRLLVRRPRPAFGLVLRAHFAGLVANLCLPGVAGGDVVRAGWLIRSIGAAESVAVASLADRGVDVAALLGLVGVGWLLLQPGDAMPVPAARPLAVAVAAGLTAGLVLAAALARTRRGGIAGRLGAAIRVLAGRPHVVVAALALSMAVQATFVLVNVWLGIAIGLQVPAAAWFVAWPLAKLIALVPISLGGLGVREAALVGLLAPAGANASGTMAVGLLWEVVLVAGGLLGWVVTAASGWTVRGPEAPSR